MGQIEPGQNLGRYRIVRRLGAGAMGEVYLAEDPQIDRRLAIKIVLVGEGSLQEVAALKERLLREAKAAGRLLHPHVVTLFDAGEADGVFYLAFEYVAGQDLSKRKDVDPPLTLGQVLRLIREAASGLSAAHAQGIVHRDIKPSNLLLDESGTLKIADFGIAKRMGEGSELTMTGTVVGSPHYLSPEQVRGEELGPRSDLFSLGVVLYELLTNRRPFEAEALTTLVYRILNEEARPLGELRPGLPPRLEAMVRKLLSKEPDNRFQSADELILEIETLEAELPPRALATTAALSDSDLEETRELPSSGAPIPPPPPLPGTAVSPAPGTAVQIRGGRSRVLVLLAAGLGAMVLLVLALWLSLGRSPEGGDGKDTASEENQSELVAEDDVSVPDPLRTGDQQPPDVLETDSAVGQDPESSASGSESESESKDPSPTPVSAQEEPPMESATRAVSQPGTKATTSPPPTSTRQPSISTAPRTVVREPPPPGEGPRRDADSGSGDRGRGSRARVGPPAALRRVSPRHLRPAP